MIKTLVVYRHLVSEPALHRSGVTSETPYISGIVSGVDLNKVDFSKANPVGIDPRLLKDMGIGPERYRDLAADLRRIETVSIDLTKVTRAPLRRVGGRIDEFLGINTIELVAR